jgi:signal transduction histidine kinase
VRDGAAADAPSAERLWLDTLQALGRPVAHEVRNALNGVSVNLEVVRSRAARPDAAAASVARYADVAAAQVETLAALVDALLAVVRAPGDRADAVRVVAPLVALFDAVARPEGGAVELRVAPEGEPVRTALDGATLRALAGALLAAAAERGATLTCELDGASPPTLRLRRSDSALPSPPAAARALAERAGVRLDMQGEGWVAALPADPAPR